jgi:arylsulfatase A-like enzyme
MGRALLFTITSAFAARPPHIVFIVADDLGFNDVSVHGSPQIPTPAIDALAREGVLLGNYHVQPVCSPSRSSFLSGRHVIHTGVYTPWLSNTNDHLNLSYTLLPTFLRNCCGYETVQVGKWRALLRHVSARACPRDPPFSLPNKPSFPPFSTRRFGRQHGRGAPCFEGL